jgi:hypothetical protein
MIGIYIPMYPSLIVLSIGPSNKQTTGKTTMEILRLAAEACRGLTSDNNGFFSTGDIQQCQIKLIKGICTKQISNGQIRRL